ncbi:DDE-type integrase/transposase/recombinase [Erysipelothrix tonsillarum]|uniref:DDE-type integrase/transposase/recombinase n=1 Tax=Erysipelothrix tonsillarum TaxID=38402 RepID=UPI000377042E|nr:DDE-type integrase/transposase/recombinase [Erysipelothrix tonsillarum]
MRLEGLVSVYTLAQYKVHRTNVNEDDISNIINRKLNHHERYEVIVSDLTYVRVAVKWNYICTILDLHNREIIGYSCGINKTAALVQKEFSKIDTDLSNLRYFHTDRGNEFKNKLIDEILDVFQIQRSLSQKRTPYDNAVATATFKSIKTEFVYPNTFESLNQLEVKLSAYVWWFNNKRLHSTLGYVPTD